MGFYRFILAVIVVMFHFGGFSSLAGRSAVFGFYCISGYLMTLVIDKVYSKMEYGVLAFYVNRALRIYPLYLFYMICTFLAIRLYGDTGFIIDPTDGKMVLLNPAILHINTSDFFSELNLGNRLRLRSLIVADSPTLIPQAWSLGVEMLFYISAPALFLFKRRFLWLLVIISIGYNLWALNVGLEFDDYIYKSFLGSLYMFMLGSIVYRYQDHLPVVKDPNLLLGISGLLYLVSLWFFRGELKLSVFYCVALLQLFIVFLLSQLTYRNSTYKKVDKMFGDLSWGIFVSHFFVCFIVLAISDRFLSNLSYFGRYNRSEFGFYVTIFTIMVTAAIYILVEHPIEHLRNKVRGFSTNQSNVQILRGGHD